MSLRAKVEISGEGMLSFYLNVLSSGISISDDSLCFKLLGRYGENPHATWSVSMSNPALQ